MYQLDTSTAARFDAWGITPSFGTDVRHAVSVAMLAVCSVAAPFVLVGAGAVPVELRGAVSLAVALLWAPTPWSIPGVAMSDWRDAFAPSASRRVRCAGMAGHLVRVAPVTMFVSLVAFAAAAVVSFA